MGFKVVFIILIVFLDLTAVPIFLQGIVLIIQERDLFLGIQDLANTLKLNPLGNYVNLFSDLNFLKLWLFIQPLIIIFTSYLVFKKSNNSGVPERAGKGEFGTGRFLTKEEINKTFSVWKHPEGELKTGGIMLGGEKKGKNYKFLLDCSKNHVLVIGATESGKTYRVILPSIWTLAKAGESMVVSDPKGELYELSKAHLEKMGYEIIMLNFRDIEKSKNRWNILDPIIKSAKDGPGYASEQAWDIANMIVHQKPIGSSDPIWSDGEESLMASLFLATALEADTEEKVNMSTVFNLLSQLGVENKEGEVPLDKYILSLKPNHPARVAYTAAILAKDKTKSSFFVGMATKLRLWGNPLIKWLTSNQDHNLANIGKEKTAIFLIIPDEKSTYNFLVALYLDQVYQALAKEANENGGTLPIRVNYILDEFGNIPKIKDFVTKITVSRSRNIRFLLAVQGIDQIKYHYRELANTITGNCKTWIYLLTADYDTANIISKKTGQYTIKNENHSTSSRSNDQSVGYNQGLTGRALLMPDEILRFTKIYPGKSLILPAGDYPGIINTPFMFDTSIAEEMVKGDKNNKEHSVYKALGLEVEDNKLWLPDLSKAESKNEKPKVSEEDLDNLDY